ncbi:MAG: mechanosensitive ion channel [Bacteroides sp.]|nr:mechanosensitive ion channel [Bacteroides sp.]MCM1550696.1 mechanosensitive ion channel [Clostridium sp.]
MLQISINQIMGTAEVPDISFYEKQLSRAWDWMVGKAGSILLALLCLWIGLRLSKWLMKLIRRSFERSKLDPTVSSFLGSMIHITLYVLVFITVVSIMGIQVTSFVTLLGTAGVTIGLALQGSLSNFAGGVLILMLKPFVIGDYIREDTHDNEGTVISIDIFYTRLRTFDGKVVVIPNGTLSNTSLTNLTRQEKRRLDLTIPVSYEADLQNARRVIQQVLQQENMILQEEPMDIVLDAFADSSMTVLIHVWVETENYWQAKWSTLEHVKAALDEAGIIIPYSQMDVHIN